MWRYYGQYCLICWTLCNSKLIACFVIQAQRKKGGDSDSNDSIIEDIELIEEDKDDKDKVTSFILKN